MINGAERANKEREREREREGEGGGQREETGREGVLVHESLGKMQLSQFGDI